MTEYDKYYQWFPMELSPFQKTAIQAIVDGHHSLSCVPTGSGKTLPALFAIDYFTRLGKKVIYTSPIKALSNQKYHEFSQKFPNLSVGILTGDIKQNPDANIIIMTTEILRNMLENEIKEISKTTIIVGEKEKRLPNTSCIITPGWKGESQVIAMDLEGFSISSGTACSSGKLSEVSLLKEMEYSEDLANCSIRVSLGPNTKKSDIEAFIFSWKQLYSRHNIHRDST